MRFIEKDVCHDPINQPRQLTEATWGGERERRKVEVTESTFSTGRVKKNQKNLNFKNSGLAFKGFLFFICIVMKKKEFGCVCLSSSQGFSQPPYPCHHLYPHHLCLHPYPCLHFNPLPYLLIFLMSGSSWWYKQSGQRITGSNINNVWRLEQTQQVWTPPVFAVYFWKTL